MNTENNQNSTQAPESTFCYISHMLDEVFTNVKPEHWEDFYHLCISKLLEKDEKINKSTIDPDTRLFKNMAQEIETIIREKCQPGFEGGILNEKVATACIVEMLIKRNNEIKKATLAAVVDKVTNYGEVRYQQGLNLHDSNNR